MQNELEDDGARAGTMQDELEDDGARAGTMQDELEDDGAQARAMQEEDYRDRGSYIDELEEKIESLVAAVPDVSDLVTEGPELEARMNADRADRDASEKLKYETRQAHVNRVTFLYIFIIIKLIICRYCPILLTWSL
jgi:t-SNARE complex subunit (syntaxin)